MVQQLEPQWNETWAVVKTVDDRKKLERVKNSVRHQAKIAENDLISACISEVISAVDSILPMVSSYALLQNDTYPRQIQEEFSDWIMECINPSLSLDDPLCTELLNILDDQQRAYTSSRYQASVLSRAEQFFKSECGKVKTSSSIRLWIWRRSASGSKSGNVRN